MSLSDLYVAHLDSMKEDKERDPFRLFVSDIGKCPRMIGYRMMETEKNYEPEQTRVNKTIMFDLAEHIESILADALNASGDLIDYQPDVEFGDARKNWGGRADIIANYFGRRVIEVKTVHPNAFKFDLDYPEHHFQAKCYDVFMREKYELDTPPLLVYFDRGGQNTPVEKEVLVSEVLLQAKMNELELARDVLPDLQPKLGKVLKLRDRKLSIKLEPDHRCNYCDYSDFCVPLAGTETWAKRENDKVPFTATKKATDADKLAAFAQWMLEEIV